jgi:hypothetical protein
MNDYYGNSFLNIAAAHAKNRSQGCFVDEYSARIERVQARAFVKEECIRFAISLESLDLARTAPRSKNVIFFSQTRLFWERVQTHACESHPTISDDDSASYFRHGIQKTKLSENWFTIIQQYSECKLSHSYDKLAALSGILEAIYSQRNDE